MYAQTRQSQPAPKPSRQPTHDDALAIQKSLEAVTLALRDLRADAAKRDQQAEAERVSYYRDKLPDFLVVIGTGVAASIALRTLRQLRRQNDLVNRSAVAAVANARSAQDNASSASHQSEISAASLATSREIERAYLTLKEARVYFTAPPQ
jgi:hypothetical protein